MLPNPVLRRLGFADTDRVAIIHTDDIGMCQASITAFIELSEFGLISSGAVMVPCPWFLEAARFCREHPQVDMGIHLTLNSEWLTYRWGPLSTRDPSSGLLDSEGYFHRTAEPVQANADPAAVFCELETQIKRAISAGMHPTHIDTHMGTIAHAKFTPSYLQLSIQYHLPAMLFRMDAAGWEATGMDPESAGLAAMLVNQLEEAGTPLLDAMVGMPLEHADNRFEVVKDAFDHLPVGITHFIIHPSADTPELRAITPDWPARVVDYHLFQDERLRAYLNSSGIQIIGYRALQELS